MTIVIFSQILTIIVPIFFVLLLGYVAGLAKKFDSDQVAGMNELVLDFALPASLFGGMFFTSRYNAVASDGVGTSRCSEM